MFKSNKNESNKISKKETIRRVAILPSKELHRLSVDFSRARVEARRQSNYISYMCLKKVPANLEFYIQQKYLSVKNAILFLVFCLDENA